MSTSTRGITEDNSVNCAAKRISSLTSNDEVLQVKGQTSHERALGKSLSNMLNCQVEETKDMGISFSCFCPIKLYTILIKKPKTNKQTCFEHQLCVKHFDRWIGIQKQKETELYLPKLFISNLGIWTTEEKI